jgi:dGTPase
MTNYPQAEYSTDEKNSKGKHYLENFEDTKYHSVFDRDRDRVINSAAFRRLQYKTQVFVNHQGDHFRTRLTHSLEVAQIAIIIAKAMNLNQDLAEIISLCHDLGHPPFGHAGESAINKKMLQYSGNQIGFCHNANTLKILTETENRFIGFCGLNLSWEVLEGVVKHNGKFNLTEKKLSKNKENIADFILTYNKKFDLELDKNPSLEAQISAISDDIAYNNHDIEDGIRADLFKIEDVFDLPIIGKIYQNLIEKYPSISREIITSEAKRKLTSLMIDDVVENSKINLKKNNISSIEDVKNHDDFLISFSLEMQKVNQEIKNFLYQKMYRHEKVNKMSQNAEIIIDKLFDNYISNLENLPFEQINLAKKISFKNADENQLIIFICDYISCMTDRFAIKEFERITT